MASIRAALDHHNSECAQPAHAILLHPDDHAELGLPRLWGLPAVADERCRPGFLRIDCSGSAWQIETELAAYLEELDRRIEPGPTRDVRARAFWDQRLLPERAAM
jgi:hypothetical protein